MNELKDICCDFEWSKKLKEKGFPQNNYACVHINNDMWCPRNHLLNHSLKEKIWDYWISAPTSEELLRELPKKLKGYDRYLRIGYVSNIEDKELNIPYVSYTNVEKKKTNECYFDIDNKKLCNALARCWIYLKDSNLLKEQINERD